MNKFNRCKIYVNVYLEFGQHGQNPQPGPKTKEKLMIKENILDQFLTALLSQKVQKNIF